MDDRKDLLDKDKKRISQFEELEEIGKMNLCNNCVYLNHLRTLTGNTDEPPTCQKRLHKDYNPITKCKEFINKENVNKALSKIEMILFELEEKEKDIAIKGFLNQYV